MLKGYKDFAHLQMHWKSEISLSSVGNAVQFAKSRSIPLPKQGAEFQIEPVLSRAGQLPLRQPR